MKKIFLLILSVLVILTATIFGFSSWNENLNQKEIYVNLMETDNFKTDLLKNFTYEDVEYKVTTRKIKLSNQGDNLNILVTEAFVRNNEENRCFLKETVERGGVLIVETNKPPYILLGLLNIDMEKVIPGDFYPKDTDIAAFGIFNMDNMYHVGYAKLNRVKRYSRDYYETLLRGFIR